MEKFYDNLAKGTATSPISKAEALRQAQLELLHTKITQENYPKDYRLPRTEQNITLAHPYYWAPFILMGRGL